MAAKIKQIIAKKLGNKAKNFLSPKDIAEEYGVIFIFVLLIELSAVAFSVNGGNVFFYNIFISHLQNATLTMVASYMLMIFVESTAFMLLWLFYKKMFQTDKKQ